MARPPTTRGKGLPAVRLASVANADCDGKFVPFVKMIKGINRELGEPVSPSFLLEVMAQTLVKAPFGRYQDEIVLFLATAAEQIGDQWDDPAGLGGDVNTVMSPGEKLTAAAALRSAQEIAERAVDLEDDGQEYAADSSPAAAKTSASSPAGSIPPEAYTIPMTSSSPRNRTWDGTPASAAATPRWSWPQP
jgi:hypothetical protein